MGIRDISYYAWQTIRQKYGTDRRLFQYTAFHIDISGNYYLAGTRYDVASTKAQWFIERSIDLGKTWTELDTFTGTFQVNQANQNGNGYTSFYNCPEAIVVDSTNLNKIIVVGRERSGALNNRGYVRLSTDNGVTWNTILQITGSFRDIKQRPSDNIFFVAGSSGTYSQEKWYILSSSTGLSNSYSAVDYLTGGLTGAVGSASLARKLAFSASTTFAVGFQRSANTNYSIARSGTNTAFNYIYTAPYSPEPFGPAMVDVACHADSGSLYLIEVNTGFSGQSTSYMNRIYFSNTRLTNSFSQIAPQGPNIGGGIGQVALALQEDNIYLLTQNPNNLSTNPHMYAKISKAALTPSSKSFSAVTFSNYRVKRPTEDGYFLDDWSYGYDAIWYNSGTKEVFFTGRAADDSLVLVKGKLSTNSASIGPITLNASIGFSKDESATGVPESGFSLANISEFPHAGGLFQMKNMVLGTQTSGKVGKGEDSIVQIKHIGSTVKIMWPRQENGDSTLFGYGDLSLGQSIGKLSTNLEPGDFIDVTEFDHMSLYCYLQKRVSGTLDDIMIEVERKPIRDIGFATDQVISYSISGSITEARLRDLYYVKAIDYGDLSIREVAWPIDIPLTNTKQVRISAKFKNGQVADQNKNFIVYGRFIKASKDTNET